MEEPFERLKTIACDFYRGWKWSLEHKYNRKEYEAFVNQVEEPLNCEVSRLLNQGYSMNQIDAVMVAARNEIWPDTKESAVKNLAASAKKEI